MSTDNPFTRIYDQLDRIESMVLEIKEQLEGKNDRIYDNGIEMAIRVTGYRRNTIYKLVNLRQIPHSKHRGKLVFDEEALRKWARGNKRLAEH